MKLNCKWSRKCLLHGLYLFRDIRIMIYFRRIIDILFINMVGKKYRRVDKAYKMESLLNMIYLIKLKRFVSNCLIIMTIKWYWGWTKYFYSFKYWLCRKFFFNFIQFAYINGCLSKLMKLILLHLFLCILPWSLELFKAFLFLLFNILCILLSNSLQQLSIYLFFNLLISFGYSCFLLIALHSNIFTWRFINNSIDAANYRSNNE